MLIYTRRSSSLAGTPFRIFCGLALMLMANIAWANKPANITEAEMRLIPKYCPDTMGFGYGDAYYNTSPRARHWTGLMGNGFWAMHHYCWGQINLLRAQRSGVSSQFRRGTLEGVRDDFQYVLNHTSSNFIMRPEVLTQLGKVELMLAKPNAANAAFAKARELKPDYWPAYSHWAEFLIRIDKRADAKQLLQTGLEYSPTAKVLIEQYRMVGGKPSDIVPRPVTTEAEGAASTATAEGADAAETKPETPAPEKTAD